MIKSEYEAYQAYVAQFFEDENLEFPSTGDEEYFTWRPCDLCGRPEGGQRVDLHAVEKQSGKVVGPYEACLDCAYYIEYGRLDDNTMMEMEGV